MRLNHGQNGLFVRSRAPHGSGTRLDHPRQDLRTERVAYRLGQYAVVEELVIGGWRRLD